MEGLEPSTSVLLCVYGDQHTGHKHVTLPTELHLQCQSLTKFISNSGSRDSQ